MKRNSKKLSLAKQTIRHLDSNDLGAVNGGATTVYTCIPVPINTTGCQYPVPLPPSMMASLYTC